MPANIPIEPLTISAYDGLTIKSATDRPMQISAGKHKPVTVSRDRPATVATPVYFNNAHTGGVQLRGLMMFRLISFKSGIWNASPMHSYSFRIRTYRLQNGS